MNLLEHLLHLGSPHLKIPPVIHIAGTNGKGSAIAMLRSILEAAGKKVHIFTSPHLVSPLERIVVSGKRISQVEYDCLLKEVGNDHSYFQQHLLMAFLAFSRNEADYTLLEVGIGGRHDATNVIAPPLIAAFSQIDLDHQDVLGNSLQLIASEKAGIIKPGCQVVTVQQTEEVMEVLSANAFVCACSMIVACGYYTTNLEGAHQHDNAALAAAISQCLGIEQVFIQKGLLTVNWPGRLQLLSHPRITELWIDGAHNPSGARAVVQFMAKPYDMIVALHKNKDISGFFEQFNNGPRNIYSVCLGADFYSAEDLPGHPCNNLEEALGLVNTDRVLCTGSLYLVGEILRKFGSSP